VLGIDLGPDLDQVMLGPGRSRSPEGGALGKGAGEMRIDDPGWGDYVPLPGEQGKEPEGQAGGSPPTSGPPTQPPRAPWWRSRTGIAVGVGVLVVVVIVAVATAGRGPGQNAGGSSNTGASPNTGGSNGGGSNGGGSNVDGSSNGGTPAPLPSPTDQYLANANAICATHRPEIVNTFNTMTASGNASGLISALQSLQSELQGLGTPPAEGADTYIDDLGLWIQSFQEGAFANAQVMQSAMATHSKEAGLQNCPPN
jgi:hypothetical protein